LEGILKRIFETLRFSFFFFETLHFLFLSFSFSFKTVDTLSKEQHF